MLSYFAFEFEFEFEFAAYPKDIICWKCASFYKVDFFFNANGTTCKTPLILMHWYNVLVHEMAMGVLIHSNLRYSFSHSAPHRVYSH